MLHVASDENQSLLWNMTTKLRGMETQQLKLCSPGYTKVWSYTKYLQKKQLL